MLSPPVLAIGCDGGNDGQVSVFEIEVLSDDAIIFVVLANPIPVYSIAVQDAQSAIVASDADRHPATYTLEAQPRQAGILTPQLESFSCALLYIRWQHLKRFPKATGGM
jgi:hypothetical protein